MKINVTQECINSGLKGNKHYCPIALAIKNTIPHVHYVSVNLNKIHLTIGNQNSSAELPKQAREFIEKFDSKELVQPFEFEININQEID